MIPFARLSSRLIRFSVHVAGWLWVLPVLAVFFFSVGIMIGSPIWGLIGVAIGMTLVVLSGLALFLASLGRRGRRRWRRMAEAAAFHLPSPAIVSDRRGHIVYANPAACKTFDARDGIDLGQVLGRVFASAEFMVHKLQNEALQNGAVSEDVATRRKRFRIQVHVFSRAAFFWQILEMPPETREKIFAEGQLPMLKIGRGGTILFMNVAAHRMLGTQPRHVDDLWPHGVPCSGALSELEAEGGSRYFRVIDMETPEGRREIYLCPQEEVEKPGDLDLLESLPVAFLKISVNGRIQMINRLGRDLLGVLGDAPRNFFELVEGPGRPVRDWLADTVRGRAVHRSEVLRVLREDRELFVQVALERVADGGVIAVLHDATDLKTLEAQFVQSQKMQAIGQLAGGVAHDFNNLLTAISGHCDLLLLRHDEGDPHYGDLMQINQNANRAASLVRQLLAFSRKQTLRPELIDLRDALTDLGHLLNRLVGETVALKLSHAPGACCIRADKRQMEQVIMNLVVNARDAMPDGGQVLIETLHYALNEELHRDRVVVPPGNYILIRVTDEGVGIAKDRLSKVFEPFYSTKKVGEGTGLGLSTAYGIVKQSGGFIFVDSVVGAGTSFTLYFPAAYPKEMVAISGQTATPPPKRQNSGTVLLVEDEAPVRAFAARALQMRGMNVIKASSAEEALEFLGDESLAVDVFVTDVIMPGLDGPSWVRQALETRPRTRVVFMSGYAEEAVADALAHIENSVFLPKPFSLADLTATVSAQLG
ncbi:multi-sensor hybrid histidine kinase [Rhodovulum imhoffii]|uniref:histidine kinase n=2 Tax=Rhodovulum imhoffii TaxID=365340 RepID=A0A2T5BVA1_9RHOB|nr:ATP-binding protein [Rhodovulum imhoffii]PTN03504.1 multi-sensor hybrid histidine kinase [Rhodovulum imhoffii]